ncbi:putative nudix hydrolase 1 [Folsomia candida]|uniref:Putative nudix hydrolase 1 n=2 Tax=Folsomia candida TaxID=158441 RepID=A0A226E0N5_FOLCA|nr:putative nudix hydrolase 1 [Folsomia candida]
MDQIEPQVKQMLNGGGNTEDITYCDFTLADQNEALASKGVGSSGPTDFVPITKKTVTYIVAAVLVNEDNEVLMMQEAKPSCSGQWYLPAGRMEPGETIQEAVKREVLEETGLDMEPTTLLMVESAVGCWFRFVFTGTVIGGRLKTTAEADKESLQARWVKDVTEIPLRAKDILPLIERGLEYHLNRNEPWHSKIMPVLVGRTKLYMRIIVAVRKKSNNKVSVLVGERNHCHLPICEIHPQKSLHSTLRKYMNEIFGADLPPHRPHGILSVEYNGKPRDTHDGMTLNLLVSVRQPLEDVVIIDKYTWKEVGSSVGDELLRRMGKNLTIPLHVI